MAGKLARAGKFHEALCDSRGRRRKSPRVAGNVLGETAHCSPQPEATPTGARGLKALVRGLKDEAEMEAIGEALEKTHWCRKDAAKMLGISYKALLYKMRQFNLDRAADHATAPAVPAAPVAERVGPLRVAELHLQRVAYSEHTTE